MDSVAQKRCATCSTIQPISAFHRNRQQKDGYSVYCRGCASVRSRANYQAHRESRGAYSKARWAATRGQQTDEQRAKRHVWERGYRARRVSQRATAQQTWRAQHQGEVRAYKRAWVAEHREVVREAVRQRYIRQCRATIVPFTTAQLQARMAYWGHRCWVCQGAANAVDHVKPLAKGGPHCLANLRPICRGCNSRKRDQWPYPLVWERLQRKR